MEKHKREGLWENSQLKIASPRGIHENYEIINIKDEIPI